METTQKAIVAIFRHILSGVNAGFFAQQLIAAYRRA